MKAKLIKSGNHYHLFEGDRFISTTDCKKGTPNKLSKQNCDEIFGVVDVEKLAENYEKENFNGDLEHHPLQIFKAGFNKAMELNKDKVYSKEDIENAFNLGLGFDGEKGETDTFKEFIRFIQKPTEIEVEIVKEPVYEGLDEMAQPQYAKVPKLDSNGCIILKKI
jgi:hypothetical protein